MQRKKILRILLILLFIVWSIGEIMTISKPKHNPDPTKDLLAIEEVPDDIVHLLKVACNDCHTQKTVYPWYSYVFPVSYWIDGHVEHALHHLDFSDWGNYDEGKRKHKAEEVVELVENREMPLPSYTWMHKDAKLDEEERRKIVTYFMTLQ